MSGRGCGPVPNRWMKCPRKCESFIADKFLAFKTPLSSKFNTQVVDCDRFQPELIFANMRSYKKNLGLWIDLTNTSRFYDRKEVEANKCKYIKLSCRGHGETPSVEQTRSFIEIVDNFINDHPTDIIGVHCTHGFNRTGFLIVSYMVEQMDCAVEAALMAFSQSRPPGIYKADYIKELFKRYENDEDALPAPPMPAWCFEEEEPEEEPQNKRSFNEDNDDGGDGSSTSDQTNKKKKKRELVKKNAKFMHGVPGVHLVSEPNQLADLQQEVQDMCNWKSNGFPGCQPVSMDQDNMKLLHLHPYRVSWKADGTRYMMLIRGEGEIYFFDRDHACFQVSGIRFVRRKDLKTHLTNTLLDGEMVIDKNNGQCFPRFLVYDIIKFEGKDIGKEHFFPVRLHCIEHEIINPRYEAIKNGIINKTHEPFSIRNKSFWEVKQARALLGDKFAKTLLHEPDGLIFQPSAEPYVTGQCDEVLKWKPENLNSVDFRLKIIEESGVGILSRKIGCLFVGQLDAPFARIKYTKALKDYDNKIIECKFENNSWIFMRERDDKSFPNSFKTAKGVCKSILNPVTTEMLLNLIEKYRFADDSDMMPPPERKHSSTTAHTN